MNDYLPRSPIKDEVVIPHGCQLFHEWMMKNPGQEIGDQTRLYKKAYLFVFDPENADHKEFLAECKEDTNLLRAALEIELQEQGLPISVRKNQKKEKGKRTMSFLIRPPYLESKDPRKTPNKMQWSGSNKDNFILHYDQEYNFISARTWKAGLDEDTTDWRISINNAIHLERDFFTKNYGDWEAMAQKIAEIIKACLAGLDGEGTLTI